MANDICKQSFVKSIKSVDQKNNIDLILVFSILLISVKYFVKYVNSF